MVRAYTVYRQEGIRSCTLTLNSHAIVVVVFLAVLFHNNDTHHDNMGAAMFNIICTTDPISLKDLPDISGLPCSIDQGTETCVTVYFESEANRRAF